MNNEFEFPTSQIDTLPQTTPANANLLFWK